MASTLLKYVISSIISRRTKISEGPVVNSALFRGGAVKVAVKYFNSISIVDFLTYCKIWKIGTSHCLKNIRLVINYVYMDMFMV